MFTYTKAVKSHHLWTLYICSFHFLLLASTIKYNVRLDLKRFSTQVYKYWRYWLYCCYYAIFYVLAILSYFKHVKTLFKEKIIMILRKHGESTHFVMFVFFNWYWQCTKTMQFKRTKAITKCDASTHLVDWFSYGFLCWKTTESYVSITSK